MASVDCESKVCMAVDVMHEELRRYRSLELRVEIRAAVVGFADMWWTADLAEARPDQVERQERNATEGKTHA